MIYVLNLYNFFQALNLLEEIKEGLFSVLLPQHTRLKQQISEILDSELIKQQALQGTLDFKVRKRENETNATSENTSTFLAICCLLKTTINNNPAHHYKLNKILYIGKVFLQRKYNCFYMRFNQTIIFPSIFFNPLKGFFIFLCF